MRYVKADLHNHFSTKSRVLDPNKIADTVRGRLGIGGICALVNYGCQRFEAFARKAESSATRLGNAVYFPDREVLIVKGEEVPTEDGDLLVLGTQEGFHMALRRQTLEYSLREATEEGNGITIIPHPYFHSRVGEKIEKEPEILSSVDAIEIHNGQSSYRSNNKARRLHRKVGARFYNLGKLASSDGHSYFEVGKSWTALQMPRDFSQLNNSESLIENLRRAIKETSDYFSDESPYDYDYSDERFRRERSITGTLIHAGILASMIVGDGILRKFGKQISRGDAEALRQYN